MNAEIPIPDRLAFSPPGGRGRSIFRAFFAGLLLSGIAFAPRIAPAQETASADVFRESVAVETNAAVNKRINDAREYIAGGKWQLAVDILHGMLTSGDQVLVPMQPGLYVNSRRRCHLLLTQLPAAGRAVYQNKADPQAKVWYEAALKDRSAPGMLRVVQRAFASRYGDDALWHLGNWAWERGDVEKAREYWSQLLPVPEGTPPTLARTMLRYPAPDLDRAAIEARCILCDIVVGRLARAKSALAEFQKRFPQARGTIAGREGLLTTLLAKTLADAEHWPFPRSTDESTTFAGNHRRNWLPPPPADVGAALWARKLAWNRLPTPDDNAGPPPRRHPACFPICVDGVIYVPTADRVFAYDAQTGKPAFPVDTSDKTPPEQRAVVYPEAPGKPSPPPLRESVGVPRFSVTVRGGRLFARLGSPITGRSAKEVRAARSELVCYRLGVDTGRLEWKLTAESIGRGWEFEGAPVVSEGRLYVAMRRRFPETQLYVVCLDSRSGREIWKQRICTALSVIGEEHNHVSHHLLTLAGGTIYYSTNIGAIAAVNADDGSIRWLATYETRAFPRLADASNAMKAGMSTCLYAEGIVVAAPSDSREIFGIDAHTGVVRWKRALRGGVRHLLGARANRLIVSGNRLWGLALATGGVMWNRGFEDPAGFGYGRGLLAGELVYWPLREEILVVKQSTGAIERRIALRALHNGRGGNLSLAEGRLVVAEPSRLVVYGIFGTRPETDKPDAAATPESRSNPDSNR